MKIIEGNYHRPLWAVQNVSALSTTRCHPLLDNSVGGVYGGFNIGMHVGDNVVNVQNNRDTLAQLLPKNNKIQWLEQVHGSDVTLVQQHSDLAIVADAAITQVKGLSLAVMTADCLPILLAAGDGSEIAVIHGGWRSLASNIIAKTLSKMLTCTDDVFAWFGPCLSANYFEVGDDVRMAFVQQSSDFHPAFIKQPTGKYLANLHLIAQLQLQAIGVHNLSCLAHCTYAMSQDYYSYRREGQTGRMASVICRT